MCFQTALSADDAHGRTAVITTMVQRYSLCAYRVIHNAGGSWPCGIMGDYQDLVAADQEEERADILIRGGGKAQTPRFALV